MSSLADYQITNIDEIPSPSLVVFRKYVEHNIKTVGEIVGGYEYSQYNSEQDQATFLLRAFQKVRNEYPYVTHMFVWNLNFQQVVGPTDEKYGFGILHSSGGHRPAYDALKAMSK